MLLYFSQNYWVIQFSCFVHLLTMFQGFDIEREIRGVTFKRSIWINTYIHTYFIRSNSPTLELIYLERIKSKSNTILKEKKKHIQPIMSFNFYHLEAVLGKVLKFHYSSRVEYWGKNGYSSRVEYQYFRSIRVE